jgi:hypothetical protein
MDTKKDGGNKKKAGSGKKRKVAKGRRQFMKVGATVAAGLGLAGAVGSGAAGCATPDASAALGNYPLRQDQWNYMLSHPDMVKSYLADVQQLAKTLVGDPVARAAFLENADSVLLTRIYNENRATLEPVVGVVDGRTLEGRLTKMIHVSELFENVAGMDGVYATNGEDTLEQQCATNGSTANGCCVCHYWGWSSGAGHCTSIIATLS